MFDLRNQGFLLVKVLFHQISDHLIILKDTTKKAHPLSWNCFKCQPTEPSLPILMCHSIYCYRKVTIHMRQYFNMNQHSFLKFIIVTKLTKGLISVLF